MRLVSVAAVVAASMAFGARARGADPEVFPGATADPAETAALLPAAAPVAVFRTGRPFGIVLNYYRFKRKQAVHVTEEDLAARFRNIAAAFERPGPPEILLREPLVRRFHQRVFGRVEVAAATAAKAWREYARRYSGRTQRVGEGERVTLYRPYLSQRTFDLIDETVIVIRIHGEHTNERATPTDGSDGRLSGGPGQRGAGTDR